jgi:glycosyltransferase involved in cell wall biosynthesis
MPLSTPTTPLVAIATPVYNGAQFLAETMECVQAQTYPNIVHYVMDNASTDATPDIINRYKGRRVPVISARNEITLSLTDNWNAAVRLIQGRPAYFRLLAADNLMAPDGIEKMVAIGEQNPEVGVLGCQEWSGDLLLGWELPHDRDVFDGRSIARSCLLNAIHGFPHSHCLYRVPRDGLPESFFDLEFYGTPLLLIDVDVGLRALAHGAYGYVHEPLVTTRLHSGSVTSTEYEPNHLRLWAELQLIDRWGPAVFDSRMDYLKCRRRHLRFYYRHLLLFRIRKRVALYEKHLEWLRRASAEPTIGSYLRAVLEWPAVRAARRFKKMALQQSLLTRQVEVA